jgi:hypothetical protein
VADSENNTIRRSVAPPSVTCAPASQIVMPGANVQLATKCHERFPVRYHGGLAASIFPAPPAPRWLWIRCRFANAGNYSVTVVSDAGSATRRRRDARGDFTTLTSQLSNISVRTALTSGDVVTVGIAIDGGTRDILVRAVGPRSFRWVCAQAIADPRLELFNGASLVLSNDDWPAVLARRLPAQAHSLCRSEAETLPFAAICKAPIRFRPRGPGPAWFWWRHMRSARRVIHD